MTMAETATLSSKFQISIPKAIRAAQHWEAGLTFAFIPKGTGVLLVPVPKRQDLKGLATGANPEDYRDRADRAAVTYFLCQFLCWKRSLDVRGPGRMPGTVCLLLQHGGRPRTPTRCVRSVANGPAAD